MLISNFIMRFKYIDRDWIRCYLTIESEAEFKEFGQRLRFETQLKFGWFRLTVY